MSKDQRQVLTGEPNTASILFTLNEAADLLEIPPKALRLMVASGYIQPAEPGSKGRGRTHRFDLIQMNALATLIGLHRNRTVPGWLAKQTLHDYCQWPLTAVEHVLRLRGDSWSEETYAKALHPRPPEEWETDPETGKRQEYPIHPDELPDLLELVRVMGRLRNAVLVKLGRVDRIASANRKTT